MPPNDERNHDMNDPNLGKVHIRVPELCICGTSSEVKTAISKIEEWLHELTRNSSFYESEIFYDSLKGMDKEDLEMLNIRLCIECAAFVECDKRQGVKGIYITGLLKLKAFQIIYFHPVFEFSRKYEISLIFRQNISIYPRYWSRVKSQGLKSYELCDTLPVENKIIKIKNKTLEYKMVFNHIDNPLGISVFLQLNEWRFIWNQKNWACPVPDAL